MSLTAAFAEFSSKWRRRFSYLPGGSQNSTVVQEFSRDDDRGTGLAVFLADRYTHTVAPASAAGYARDVLDQAYRRAFCEHGSRMQQLAECGADRGELTAQFTAIRAELADLGRRAEGAAKPGWDRA